MSQPWRNPTLWVFENSLVSETAPPPPTSKTKTLGDICKINKSWLHFEISTQHELATLIKITLKSLTYNVFTFVRIFHPKRAWSGFGANECSPGDKSLSHQGFDTGVDKTSGLGLLVSWRSRRRLWQIRNR